MDAPVGWPARTAALCPAYTVGHGAGQLQLASRGGEADEREAMVVRGGQRRGGRHRLRPHRRVGAWLDVAIEAVAAMSHKAAIIIDVRPNSGGDERMRSGWPAALRMSGGLLSLTLDRKR